MRIVLLALSWGIVGLAGLLGLYVMVRFLTFAVLRSIEQWKERGHGETKDEEEQP